MNRWPMLVKNTGYPYSKAPRSKSFFLFLFEVPSDTPDAIFDVLISVILFDDQFRVGQDKILCHTNNLGNTFMCVIDFMHNMVEQTSFSGGIDTGAPSTGTQQVPNSSRWCGKDVGSGRQGCSFRHLYHKRHRSAPTVEPKFAVSNSVHFCIIIIEASTLLKLDPPIDV